MVDLREHAQRLIDRADDVIDVGLEQKDRTMIVGDLHEVANYVDAILETLFGLVLGMMHPVAFGRERSGLGDHIGAAEIARVTNDRLEVIEPAFALVFVGVADIGIPGNAADRQMMLAKGVANLAAFVLRD